MFIIYVHDPQPYNDDYAVGPFDRREDAEEYGAGMRAGVGPDGATTVLELEDPTPFIQLAKQIMN